MLKKYLATGVIILLPITLTIMIVTWLFHLFTTPFVGITESLVVAFTGIDVEHHHNLVLFISRIFALVFVVILTLVLGFFGRRFFFKTLLNLTNAIFSRLPFVKAIYRISKEVTGAIFSQDTKTFKKTVFVPFPNMETQTLGFLTGEAPAIFKKAIPSVDQTVFICTSPHPLSGYMLLCPKKNVIDAEMGIEEAFKFLLSCGAVHPGEKVEDPMHPSRNS
jgi:uncharacterized membrane protein